MNQMPQMPNKQGFMDPMHKKLGELKNEVGRCQSDNQTKQLLDNITSSIKMLDEYLSEVKIYIVFMGTTSSGKSTLINSLIGSQLLPSRNQQCTSQVLMIRHGDFIEIDNRFVSTLEMASELLYSAQESNLNEMVYIRTPSHFHSQLSPDLRQRVYFIDTPGIHMSQCRIESYLEHFQKIENKLQIDKHSFRINVWIGNYTTLDSDMELQKLMLSSFSEQAKRDSFTESNVLDIEGEHSIESDQSRQSVVEEQRFQFLYMLNKLDERRQTEDAPIEEICDSIRKVIGQNHLFKISALMALRYNIMNYGTQQAKDKFITQFYSDNKLLIPLNSREEASTHCLKKIQPNHQLLQFQDYTKFTNQLTLMIQEYIKNGFYGQLFNSIIQEISLVELMKSSYKYNQLNQQQKDRLYEVLESFDMRISVYMNQLRNFQSSFIEQCNATIKQNMQRVILPNADHKAIIKTVCSQTMYDFHKINDVLQNYSRSVKQQLLDQLKSIIEQEILLEQNVEFIGPVSILMRGCESIYQSFNDNLIYQNQQLAFERYSSELNSKLGIKIYKYQKQAGYVATGLSMATLLSSRFIVSGGSMLVPPMLALIGMGIVGLQFEGIVIQQFDNDIVNNNIQSWGDSLAIQINDLVSSYIDIYTNTLHGIYGLLHRVLE